MAAGCATTAPHGTVHAASAGTAVLAPRVTIADGGNSILYDAEPAIEAALGPAVRFDHHTLPSFGFTTYARNWRSVLGRDVLRDDPAVVVMLMGNADFGLAEQHADQYRRLLVDAVSLLTAHGAKVLWLGLPPLPPSAANEVGRRTVNALYAELPDRFPGQVRYVSTDDVLGIAGVWAWALPDDPKDPIRKVQPNGTPDEHVCPEGGVRVAEVVRDELTALEVPLPPAPVGWSAGRWRRDGRYDDPKGACTTVPSVGGTLAGAASGGTVHGAKR